MRAGLKKAGYKTESKKKSNGKFLGIISSGEDCANSKFPEVYTRIGKYYNWILETTGITYKYTLIGYIVN